MNDYPRLLNCLFAGLILSSCSGGPARVEARDVGCDTPSVDCTDASPDASDASDSEADTAAATDDGDWPASGECADISTTPTFSVPGEFSKPANSFQGTFSKESMRETLQAAGQFSEMAKYHAVDPVHADSHNYNFFANPGEEIVFQLGFASKEAAEPGDMLHVSVLVDYQPITSKYVRWLDTRGGESEVFESTGVRIPVQGDVELVDVELPVSSLTPGRAHQISVMISRRSFNSPVRDRASFFRDFMLYYGGYELPETPTCFESSIKTVENDTERAVLNETQNGDGLVFPTGVADASNVREPISVQPGEEVSLNLSLMSSTFPTQPRVAIPFVNGQPMTRRWFHVHESSQGHGGKFEIGLRKQFEFEAPEAPGTYDVFVGIWGDPLLPVYDLESNRIEGRSASAYWNTNTLRFVVEGE